MRRDGLFFGAGRDVYGVELERDGRSARVELPARRLERVLRDWKVPSTPVHVVYPSSRYLSPKVKTFVDHLYQRMTPPPWELGPAP
nr:hypothetical protein [uncultured bacterium]